MIARLGEAMYLTDQELAERFKDRRPGLDLLAIENAALPVTVLNVKVLAQERKDVGLLDEFLLRTAESGLAEVPDIASFLGISPGLLETAVVNQLALHNVAYTPGTRRVQLTPHGSQSARDLSTVVPVETEIPIAFDRTVWKPRSYGLRDLIRKREAEEQGMLIIPAKRSATIGKSDLSAQDVQHLVRTEESSNKFQVLDVMRVRRNRNAYLPVKVLVFADRHSSESELLIIVDGEESTEHEVELQVLGGSQTLNLSMAKDATGALETIPSPEADVPSAQQAEALAGSSHDSELVLRQLSVYEHGIELQTALASSATRLLIISPWVRRAVVDTQFLADLERRLRAGVSVAIGHGYGSDDRGSDADAIRRLANLQNRFSDRFILSRLPNTHAKILIHDDTYVTTSFNWLSFRGDPARTYRMEEGTLIKGKTYTDEVYSRYLAELSEHPQPRE